jgi:hypothetical protein
MSRSRLELAEPILKDPITNLVVRDIQLDNSTNIATGSIYTADVNGFALKQFNPPSATVQYNPETDTVEDIERNLLMSVGQEGTVVKPSRPAENPPGEPPRGGLIPR